MRERPCATLTPSRVMLEAQFVAVSVQLQLRRLLRQQRRRELRLRQRAQRQARRRSQRSASSSTQSSSTTPGTIGRPGKCPASDG